MKAGNLYSFFILFLLLQIFLVQATGCKKEYSYEGQDSTIIKKDSIPPIVSEFPLCALCNVNEVLQLGKWNCKTGNSYLCGNITDGIITSDKTAFTFFGPSACSLDTGLVITAYLHPVQLTTDMFNITTNKVTFYYYDRNAPSHIFISGSTSNFTLTITSYIYATGIATGTFSGGTVRRNGQTTMINEGKFKVKLRN